MALIKIGTTDMPSPSEYEVSIHDLDSENTKRTETGVLFRDRVRAGVYKIEVTWKVSGTELQIIASSLSPSKFSVTFFDPTSATNAVTDMYCGPKSGKLIKYDNSNPSNSIWELTASLIEY